MSEVGAVRPAADLGCWGVSPVRRMAPRYRYRSLGEWQLQRRKKGDCDRRIALVGQARAKPRLRTTEPMTANPATMSTQPDGSGTGEVVYGLGPAASV